MENRDDDASLQASADEPVRLTGGAAVRAHVTLGVGLAFCVVAFWFELDRALGGNSLSWAYVFEWPLLGAFAVYMWWKVVYPGSPGLTRRRRPAAIAPEFEGMLAAWQEHQRELQQSRESTSTLPEEAE